MAAKVQGAYMHFNISKEKQFNRCYANTFLNFMSPKCIMVFYVSPSKLALIDIVIEECCSEAPTYFCNFKSVTSLRST